MANAELLNDEARLYKLPSKASAWTYEEAFCRNRGLITAQEQEKLRNSRIAIVGMGGVGGVHLATLARLGIGKFTIADPDTFEVANFNRQYGAKVSTLGRKKTEVMAEIAQDINPEIQIDLLEGAISEENADRFLRSADVLVDSLDAFAIPVRRDLFRRAAALGLYAIGAGPVGFSTVWVTFSPNGMPFDSYFNFSDSMDDAQQFIAYILGMAPKATHRTYLDASEVNINERRGPCTVSACHLASGVLSTEIVKILLKRGRVRTAPYFHQFDPFIGRFATGRLRGGNRHPIQRLKAWWLRRSISLK